MTRWKMTTWFTSVAAVLALTAWAVAPGGVAVAEEVAAAVVSHESIDPCDVGHEVEAGPPPADEGEPADGSDVPWPPWPMLPPDDRPQPVDQPVCELASLTPVAC